MSDQLVSSVNYPDFFHREMTPTWLRATATALGRRTVARDQPQVWMELGCGAGMGAILTAAAHPQATFIGVDFHAGHIAAARERATGAGIGNISFREDDFLRMAQAPQHEYPACDFIVLHGVYSWVSDRTREAIRTIVQRWLKPGGLVYVAYMSHPGASSLAALQSLMRQCAREHASEPGRGVREAITLARRLLDAGTGYFAAHPELAVQLDHMEREPDAYLVHEFLSEDWRPLHVADVFADFAAVDCSWVGSGTPIENIDAISVPSQVLPVLASIHDTAQAETVRDMARNQSQRRDVFQRAAPGNTHLLSPDEHRAALLSQAIAPIPGAPSHGPLELSTRIGVVEAPDAAFTPMLQALKRAPQSYAGLARLPAYAQQAGFLNQAFLTLYWAGVAHPALPGALPVPSPSWRVNRWLCSRPAGARSWLVAPSIGTALEVSDMHYALARALLDRPGLRDHALATAAGVPADQQLAEFERDLLPAWLSYGIVPPPGMGAD